MDDQRNDGGVAGIGGGLEPWKKHMGIKLIDAYPFERDGKIGYKVKYPDDYESWSPKEEFEKAYLPLSSESSITINEIEAILADVATEKIDDKTVLVKSSMITGFREYETSSCVDPSNYDEAIGRKIASEKIKSRLWYAMGFVLQWAKYGLKNTPKIEV